MPARNNFPKLHNAAWPGVVGKGSPGAIAAASNAVSVPVTDASYR